MGFIEPLLSLFDLHPCRFHTPRRQSDLDETLEVDPAPDGYGTEKKLLRLVDHLHTDVVGDREADPPFFVIERDQVQFNNKGDFLLDVAIFSQLVVADSVDGTNLEEAVSLYRGGFLEGFLIQRTPT